MPTIKPVCQTVRTFLKANLGRHCLGCLTGQSSRALDAAVHCIALYNSCSEAAEPKALAAFRAIVETMNGSERELAYHAIAHVMDWHNRADVWVMAGLALPTSVRVCEHEPKARAVQA